ncbi:MAG: hypothetical protein Q4C34_07850, partial [Bacteroidales bacterium]|nr:hypothetical protein [Bacteroidales bacterium]
IKMLNSTQFLFIPMRLPCDAIKYVIIYVVGRLISQQSVHLLYDAFLGKIMGISLLLTYFNMHVHFAGTCGAIPLRHAISKT